MDNRLNEIRRKIRTLRLNMLDMGAAIRDQVNHDRDCTESALRLMAMRQEMTALVEEWTQLGGADRLPTIQERLRENYRPVQKPRSPSRSPGAKASQKHKPPHQQKPEKRRLTARG
jgi:hypothetical protein